MHSLSEDPVGDDAVAIQSAVKVALLKYDRHFLLLINFKRIREIEEEDNISIRGLVDGKCAGDQAGGPEVLL